MTPGPGPQDASFLIRLLILCYPKAYRDAHRDELLFGTAEAARGARREGRSWLAVALWLLGDATRTSWRIRRETLDWTRHADGSAGPMNSDGRGMMGSLIREFPFAVRSLLRSPGFALVTILTMGIGIGINAAIFSVVHSVLLAPFPFDEPEQIVTLQNRYLESGGTGWISAPEFAEYRQATDAFTHLVAVSPDASNLNGGDVPLRLQGLMVTAGYFEMLGIQPLLGRTYGRDDELPGEDPIVLSYRVWQNALAGDPDAIGKTIDLGGESRTVVGVLPEGASGLVGWVFTNREEDFWIPVRIDEHTFDRSLVERHNLFGLGRLRDGSDIPAAEASLREAVVRLEREYPDISSAGARDVAVSGLRDQVVGDVRGTLILLTLAVGLLLVVACLNISNLMMARGEARASEAAVRSAMGAGRGRMVAYGISESLVIGLAGGAIGMVLAVLSSRVMVEVVPPELALPGGLSAGAPLLLFVLAASLVAGVVTGFIPALRMSRGRVFEVIRSEAGSTGRRRGFLSRALVVGQVGAAVMLIAGAVLLTRTLGALRGVDAGFESAGMHLTQINGTRPLLEDADAVSAFYTALVDRTTELPGVEQAAVSWQTPLQTGVSDWPVMPEHAGEGEWVAADPNLVSPGFFETWSIDLVEGRTFDASDTQRATGAVILNRTAARRLWGDESAIGKRVNLSFGDPVWREVIGVVEDLRLRGLADDPRPQTYMTFGEGPFGRNPSLTMAMRGPAQPAVLRSGLATVLAGLSEGIPVDEIITMHSQIARSLARERLISALFSLFAAVALILGTIGIYGMISYSVNRRSREIGVRLAMGADASRVRGMILRQGLALGVMGVALGVAGALFTGGLLESYLFGVAGSETWTLAIVAGGMLAIAGAASLIPAWRASSLDPLETLRR